MRKPGTDGDCYQANGRKITDILIKGKGPMWKLVHGIVINQADHLPMGHCWIENNEMVLDFSNGREIEMPKMLYYALGNIVESDCIKYTAEEVRHWILETGHWGPWELETPR